MHHDAVEIITHLDLAGQARIGLNVIGEVQHVLFHRVRRTCTVRPGVVHIDMARGAGAGAAAFGLDAGDHVLDGTFHNGGAA